MRLMTPFVRNKDLVIRYVAALLSGILIAAAGCLINLMFPTVIEPERLYRKSFIESVYFFSFFSVLFHAFYGFVFIVLLYRIRVPLPLKAFITGVGISLVLYLFFMFGGGLNFFDNFGILFCAFCIGFFIPLTYRLILSRFLLNK